MTDLTARVPFHLASDGKQCLFNVRAGVPVVVALNSVYTLLEAAETLALQLNEPKCRSHERVSHACQVLVTAAMATVQACIEGMPEVED